MYVFCKLTHSGELSKKVPKLVFQSQIFKGGVQNYKDFWPKINILKGNYCILGIEIVASHQILDIILENKASQKLELSKHILQKVCSLIDILK